MPHFQQSVFVVFLQILRARKKTEVYYTSLFYRLVFLLLFIQSAFVLPLDVESGTLHPGLGSSKRSIKFTCPAHFVACSGCFSSFRCFSSPKVF